MVFLDALSSLSHEYLLMRPPCMTAADIKLGAGTPVTKMDAETSSLFAKARNIAEACEVSEAMGVRAHAARVNAPMAAGVKNAFTLLVSEVGCKVSLSFPVLF
jgi:hypothetical protein